MKTILPSGLTAIVDTVRACPVVAFQAWIKSGGADELDGERGLAHLHEHMLFKGTPTRGVGEIASAIEACGGQINAWTSSDHTCYHIILPAHEWRAGLGILADAVCHPLFDAEELAREIEVVVEEIKRAADSPSQVGYQRLFEQVFAGHPYALPVLGTAQSVRAMSAGRMRAFYEKHYRATNTTVVACGDLPEEGVLEAIAEAFADLNPGPPPERQSSDRKALAAQASVPQTTFSESRVLVGWPAPSLEHADIAALDLLAIILGQGDSSRLVRVLQRERELVNDTGATSYTPLRAGLFAITLLTSAERLQPALIAALELLRDLQAGGVSQSELDKARNNVLADATYKLETVQGLAHSAGYFEAATGDPEWENVYNARIAAVSAADIQRVARRWLGPDGLQIVAMPGTDATSSLPEAPELLRAAQKALAALPKSRASLRSGDIEDGIERIVLPSGDVLLVQPDPTVAMMGLRVASLGGLRSETAAIAGASHLLGQMLTRGTGQRSGDEIAHAIESLAAGLSGQSGRNSLGLMAVTLSKTQPQVLELFFDALFHAALPEGELEQQRRVQLEDIRHQADAPARQVMRALGAALYGAHPYGLDPLGTAQSVQDLTRHDLLAMLRGQLAPGRLCYAAAGDVDPDALADLIAAATPHDRQALPAPVAMPTPVLTEVTQIRLHAEKQQAHLALGFRGTTLYQPRRHALDVLSTLLSGQSGRLFLELRDRQSLAYTVSAMHVDGIDEGYFAVYMGTSPDKLGQALAGLRSELDKVVQSPVPMDQLDRTRRYIAGGHAIGLQRRSSRAATLCLDELYGLGRKAYRGHLEALLAVTAEDVLEAARATLDFERCVEVVLAP